MGGTPMPRRENPRAVKWCKARETGSQDQSCGQVRLIRLVDERFLLEERSLFDLKLLRQHQGPGLMVQADGVKLDLVRQRRREPGGANHTDLAAVQAQLRYVARQ